MPQLDKTGPHGKGPTGFGRGGCVNAPQRGMSNRRSRSRDFCRYVGARDTITPEEEKQLLENRLKEVEEEIAQQENK